MTVRTALHPSGPRSHHDRLLRRLDWRPSAPPSGRPVDAIIVPAARRAQHLSGLIHLAGRCDTTLVILASHLCDMEEAAGLVARTPGSGRVVLVDISSRADVDVLRLATAADNFRPLNSDRISNLSLKRNLGLLLARYRGWRKIMFLDDDVIGITQEQVTRVAHHLDTNRFAGLKTLEFPDNSVVCHANRLVGRAQGIFVSGAALGVNTADGVDLQVFPETYNEDWFAFAGEAQTAGVAHVGNVGQLQYNPFEDPQRAAFEEFGDLLAEGLYALFNDGCGVHRATESYWAQFIDERRGFIEGIRRQLGKDETHERIQALKSLQEALFQLNNIRPADCLAFVAAWKDDRDNFSRASREIVGHHDDYETAFGALGVQRWQQARFGLAKLPESAPISPSGPRR